MQREPLIKMLSHKRMKKRLKAVKLLKKAEVKDASLIPTTSEAEGMLSVHTDYSFSPYSPSLAVYMAYKSGLYFVGISDHDGVAGSEEFTQAAEILGMRSAIGMQLRTRIFEDEGKWLNNVYQKDIAFVSLRGIPHRSVKAIQDYLAPVRAKRAERDRAMVDKFNSRLKRHGIVIDFDKEVKPISKFKEGGTITERHILYAFAKKLMDKFVTADEIVEFIKDKLKVRIEEDFVLKLSDKANPYFAYDLVSCLKNEVNFFYEEATDALPVEEVVRIAHDNGALVTYPYIGETSRWYDGEEIVYHMEDDYLVELFEHLAELGFDAVEYRPDLLTPERASLITELVERNGMFTLAYSDINSPRQQFALKSENDISEVEDNMWAVVGHAKSAEFDFEDGINSQKSKSKNPDLKARLALYAEIGKIND